MLLQRTDDDKVGKERILRDSGDVGDVEAEVHRLDGLSATRWRRVQERGLDFWVLRNPFGNEFCVIQPEFPDLLAGTVPWSSNQ